MLSYPEEAKLPKRQSLQAEAARLFCLFHLWKLFKKSKTLLALIQLLFC